MRPPSCTSLSTKSYAGLGTKSWYEAFEGGGERESFAEFFLRSLMRVLVKSYAESYAVLCGGKS